jgi:hypothetical protein
MGKRNYVIILLLTLSIVSSAYSVFLFLSSYFSQSIFFVYTSKAILAYPYNILPVSSAMFGWVLLSYQLIYNNRRHIATIIRKEISGKSDDWTIYYAFKGKGGARRLTIMEALTSPRLRNEEEMLRELELPYRVVMLSSGDMGVRDFKQLDLEVFMPYQAKYREVMSNDNCTDWISRRSGIRLTDAEGNKIFAHTVDATGLAIQRTIKSILEVHQRKDGTVRVPEPLVKFTEFSTIRTRIRNKDVLTLDDQQSWDSIL